MKPSRLLLWCGLAVTVFGSQASAADRDDPETEQKSFQVREGYEVNLFASELDGVANPIQIRWDPSGRLYVACSWVYPQLEPGQVPDDKIIRLEDRDGDGRADHSQVFARGLVMPMGIEYGDDGLYVGVGTELVHLRDYDGDGIAERRETILRGFGTADSHQNINSFSWSPGGELMFSQGLHAFSRVETPWGITTLHEAGVWRLRPRRLELDAFFGDGLAPHNPWGFVYDDWGQPFLFAGNGHGIYYLSPATIRSPLCTEYPPLYNTGKKFCGVDIVGTPHLPDDMQGVMVAGGFMNNAIYCFRSEDDGAGFRLRELPPLIHSTHQSFRPVDVKVGPDGAIYIADWYNPIIGHYQTSFRHPDRDKTHGRIWRVTAKNRPVDKQVRLEGLTVPELLDQLKAPARWTRYQAKRLLAQAETSAVTNSLQRWLTQLSRDDPAFDRHWLEGLGVAEAHEAVDIAFVEPMLSARDRRARAYATGVIGRWQDRLSNPLGLLMRMVQDEDPRVRLAAVISASYVPQPGAIEVIGAAADRPMDRFISHAFKLATHGLRKHWQPAFAQGALAFSHRPERLEAILRADGSANMLKPLLTQLAAHQIKSNSVENVLRIVASVGDPDDLALLLKPTTFSFGSTNNYDPGLHARLLSVLAESTRLRKLRPAGDLADAIRTLMRVPSDAVRAEAYRLAGLWQLEALRPDLHQVASAAEADHLLRQAATEGLVDLGGEATVTLLSRLAATNQPVTVRAMAVFGWLRLDLKAAAEGGAGLLSESLPDELAAEIFTRFFQRAGGSAALARAARNRPPNSDAARVGLQVINSTGRSDAELLAVLQNAAGILGDPKVPEAAEIARLVERVKAAADPARGEEIFRRPEQNCLTCHAIAGAGGRLGPELGAVGSGQPIDFLIAAVLDPNREIKEGYLSLEATTKSGEVHQGYKIRQDDKHLVLRDVLQDKRVTLRLDQLQEVQPRGSLMPSGLTANLTGTELRDLIGFLSALGKPGQYAATNLSILRVWQKPVQLPEGARPPSQATESDTVVPPGLSWSPLYSRVSGMLSSSDLGSRANKEWAVVRTTVNVLAGGRFRLAFNSPAGLRVWLGRTPIEVQNAQVIDLAEGPQEITVWIEHSRREDPGLLVEISELANSTARLDRLPPPVP